MKTLFAIILSLSTSLSFAITADKLNEVVNEPVGEVSVEFLKNLKSTLHEIGYGYLFDDVMQTMRFDNIEELPRVIKFCKLTGNTQGHFSSGTQNTRSIMKLANQKQEDLKDYKDGQKEYLQKKILNFIATEELSLYRHIREEYPEICLLPGLKFGELVSVFAHEANHLIEHYKVFDFKLSEDYIELFETAEDYSDFKMHNSSGEQKSFIVGYRVGKILKEKGLIYYSDNHFEKYFDNDDLVDLSGFDSTIYHTHGYRNKFVKEYKTVLQKAYKSQLFYLKTLRNFEDSIMYNLNIYDPDIFYMTGYLERNRKRLAKSDPQKLKELEARLKDGVTSREDQMIFGLEVERAITRALERKSKLEDLLIRHSLDHLIGL